MGASSAPIRSLKVSAYTVPTDAPEADGTYEWNSTTLVLVEVSAEGKVGLGFTYADKACAALIQNLLRPVVEQSDAFGTRSIWQRLRQALRNSGRIGLGAMAISAVDLACWDLHARLLNAPLCRVLGMARDQVPVYGSGGFTSYSTEQLQSQLAKWVHAGIPRVKMKIGAEPSRDLLRVHRARESIGKDAQLFVDANGAMDRRSALALAQRMASEGVVWFEEPVTSEDLAGLRFLRSRCPEGMDIAAGEYASDPLDVRRLIEAEAVDVVQTDITRCSGLTGFLEAAALCEVAKVPFSAHTAPAMHLHACLAAPALRHLEYFHDHVRIERMLFDGPGQPVEGCLHPDLSRPGHGLELKHADAERYLA